MTSFCLTICALSMVLGDLAASFILPNVPGQWVKVGYLNMTDPTQQCPDSWQNVTSPRASCEKKSNGIPYCDSVNIPTNGASYQKVCGRLRGYQVGSPDGFRTFTGFPGSIEMFYVDGVSITYGSPGNRQHVYTYAAGNREYYFPSSCPCAGGTSPPDFIGSNHYCESGNNETTDYYTMLYYADVLWDRELCNHDEVACCNPPNLPWFCRNFPTPITEDLEVRICLDEGLDNENVALEFFELYILANSTASSSVANSTASSCVATTSDNSTASTSVDNSTASTSVANSTASTSAEALAIGVSVSIVAMAVLILIIIIISVAVRRKTKQRASRERIRMSNATIEVSTTHIYSFGTTDGHRKTRKSIVKYYRQHFEDILVSFDQLQMDEQPCGSGEFGVVYHATLTTKDGPTQEVAIKSTKNTYSEDIIKAFLKECASMKSFDHRNVLGLVGMCLNSPSGVPLMVLPYMANGNLKKYLQQARRYEMIDQYPEGFPCNILISMCLDIAKGMSYLADKRIVHRDLAARNCMVDIDLVIKVGDFGLSRDIYMENYYRPTKNNKCPVKWMPPEMIRDGISTEKSDVWAYGVTCWEVFSIGTTPYPGVENFEMLGHLEKGLRLQQPNLCPDNIFKLMKSCWVYDPQARPTFVQIVSNLELLSGSVKSLAEQL